MKKQTDPESSKELLIKAYNFAALYHNGQKYGDESFMVHLNDVYEVAVKYGLDKTILVASYLHDILEATDCKFDELWDEFGWEVAILVFLVTDEPGANRKERKEKTYRKTASTSKAIKLKLCDRIANVRKSKENNPKLFLMYKNEHQEFLDGLAISGTRYGLLGEMLLELNNLFEYEFNN